MLKALLGVFEVREFLADRLEHYVPELFGPIARVALGHIVKGFNDSVVDPHVYHHLGHPPFIPALPAYSKNIAQLLQNVKQYA